jgi:hypothetical protein
VYVFPSAEVHVHSQMFRWTNIVLLTTGYFDVAKLINLTAFNMIILMYYHILNSEVENILSPHLRINI